MVYERASAVLIFEFVPRPNTAKSEGLRRRAAHEILPRPFLEWTKSAAREIGREIKLSKRSESCSSATSTQSRIQRSRFSPSIFALRRSLATAQSKPFGAPIVSTFCSKAKGKRRAFSIEMLRVRNCAISAVCIGHGRPQNVFVRCWYTYSWCSHATFARECHPKVIVSQDNLGWRMRHAPGG